MNGAVLVVRALEKAGVTHAFGIAGHGNLPILDALLDSSIQFFSTAHEQVAMHAADAFYRVSGRPAVVLASVGPGLSNTITGLGDALLDSSAVIVIAGDIPNDYVGRGALQEFTVLGDDDNSTPFRTFCKRVVKPTHPSRLGDALAEAYAHATTGCPGPVLLDIPLDLQTVDVGGQVPDLTERAAGPQALRPDARLLDRSVEVLRAAQRPIIYAGGGVRSASALAGLRALVDQYQIPVATTMSGQGALAGGHPLALGTTGVVGCRPANQAIHEADVVLAIGTRFPDMDTSSWSPEIFAEVPPANLIHIDIVGSEIGRVYPANPGIVADAGAFLADFNQLLSTRLADGSGWAAWSGSCRSALAAWRQELKTAEESDAVPFSPQYVLRSLRELLPESAVLVAGVGIRHAVAQHFMAASPDRIVVGSGYGTMGQEPPAVIGAKLAAGDAPVVGIVGDGSVLASLAFMPTAGQYRIPALWIILKNGGYASINIYQMKHYERALGTVFEGLGGEPYSPDYVQIARGFGIEAIAATTPAQLREGISRARSLSAPLVLEVPVTATPSINSSGYWPVNALFAADAAARASQGASRSGR